MSEEHRTQYTIVKLANMALKYLMDCVTAEERNIRDVSTFPEKDLEDLDNWYKEQRKEIYKLVGWEYHD